MITPRVTLRGKRDRSLSCVRLPEVPELGRTPIRWYGGLRLRASAEGCVPLSTRRSISFQAVHVCHPQKIGKIARANFPSKQCAIRRA
jgi:hypothetical protein